jgi:hypothetical protein
VSIDCGQDICQGMSLDGLWFNVHRLIYHLSVTIGARKEEKRERNQRSTERGPGRRKCAGGPCGVPCSAAVHPHSIERYTTAAVSDV